MTRSVDREQSGLTYVLVDFENVQPQDMDLLRGEQYRLTIFRGPHQKRVDFDIVESLQPLGDNVKHVRSERHGKNALDFHIAFYMGRLVQEHKGNGSRESGTARFILVSKDGGFEALLQHIESLGYAATQAPSIREALGLDWPKAVNGEPAASEEAEASVPPTPASRSQKPLATANPSAVGQPHFSNEGMVAVKTPPGKQPVTPKTAAPTETSPAKTVAQKSQAPLRKTLEPADRERVIENLRVHGKHRPSGREPLERHIRTVLSNSVAIKAVRSLIRELEGDGMVKITGSKVEYKFPKRGK
jgi:hypothetical protein